MIDETLQILKQPEYLHTLLNPIPIYGLALGALGLVVALLLRSRSAQIATLAIILVSSGMAFPVYLLGQEAEDRIEGIVDDGGKEWLEEHEERAEKVVAAFYVLAFLALAALLVPLKWPPSSTWLSLAVLGLSLVTLGLGGYIAQAGGKIRHREFRTGIAPAENGENEDHSRQRGRGRGRGEREPGG